MKLARTKNALSGTFFGVLLKLYRIVGPFVIRTVFLYTLGVEYLGLDSLFTSIIQMLNLAELGVGSALVFSMYKPIAENDEEKICALMRLYRLYYRIIGAVVLTGGLALTPFLHLIIHGNIPDDVNLYVIYFLNLGVTVLSYWMFAYRNSLFNAFQRTDVISIVGLISNTFRYALQIVLLFVLKDYYWYLMVSLFEQLLNNVIMALASKKFYPRYKPMGKVDAASKKKISRTIKDLFYSKFGQVINNSFDTIVISSFLGLSVLAVYQNYYYIVSSLIGIFAIFYKACLAGIGNSLITETQEKNYNDFKKVTYLICLSLSFCVSCLLCLYPPFMKIWVKKDELQLDYTYVILLTAYFLVYEIVMLLELYKDGAGNWHKDRFRPLIAAFVNLAVNLILINFIGLYGIIISTIVSHLFINLPWIYKRLFADVFSEIPSRRYCAVLLKYCLIIAVSSAVCALICYFLPIRSPWIQMLVNFVICTAVSVGSFIAVTFRQPEFSSVRSLTNRMFGKLFRKKKKKS